MNSEKSPGFTIAVIAFDRISPFHLAAPCVVFGESHPGCPAIDFKVCAAEPGKIHTTAGFDIAIRHDLSITKRADIIIVPSWRDTAEDPPTALVQALVAAYRRGAKIVGLCLGAYVLAKTGLLDDRKATTHWAYAKDFSERFPRVKLDAGVLYVEDHGIVTSAGTAAAIDCCLYLLRQMHGPDVANSVARRLVVAPHRQGGQAQFIAQPIPQTPADTRLSGLFDWVRQNLQSPHTVDSMAARAILSRRTFTRQFKQLTGASFTVWLQLERLAYAQRLLESSAASMDVVATKAGFGSPESLRLHFRRQFGIAPTDWRKQFRGV
jgi:transcriptional regulator GlxA family with amidase domain